MRADGKRIKCTDLEYAVIPYILPHRYDSMNMITLDVPVEPIQQYRAAARKSGHVISHMGIILAAWLKTCEEYPLLNRFIVNKKIYERNEYCVGLVVMKEGQDNGTMSKIYFAPCDNLFNVQEKIDSYVSSNRSETTNNTDKLAGILLSVPGLANFGVGLIKLLDRYGLLPKAIINASPFHNSLCISNLASIRTNHIYHHCYEFGTTSIFITMGNLREIAFREKNEIVFKRCIPLGIVMDERICSGHYFAQAFTRMNEYFNDPSLLETGYNSGNK